MFGFTGAAGHEEDTLSTTLTALLAEGRPLLADGATGTNFFGVGLGPGDPPEAWNLDRPDLVRGLHRSFVEAGADIILTNTFGGTRHRLALHGLDDRVRELSRAGAELARAEGDAVERAVVVAGSVGPTGELLVPLGELTPDEAEASFAEQIAGLQEGGADVAWIETMSAPDEMLAAARAAIGLDMDYVVTASFDTAGRTMMGLRPDELDDVFAELPVAPLALGANCGVGASDLLLAASEMDPVDLPLVAKSNCGIPRFEGAEVVYDGDPALMARYVGLAVDLGVRIVGGCCGTSPEHLAAMRAALDAHEAGDRPDRGRLEHELGPLTSAPSVAAANGGRRGGRRRRSGRR